MNSKEKFVSGCNSNILHPSVPWNPIGASGSKKSSYGPPGLSSILAFGAKNEVTPSTLVQVFQMSDNGTVMTASFLRIGGLAVDFDHFFGWSTRDPF
jgi:hypothetical protein